MQAFITEELIWTIHQERVKTAVRVWLAGRVSEESSDDRTLKQRATPPVPLGLPAVPTSGRRRCCANP